MAAPLPCGACCNAGRLPCCWWPRFLACCTTHLAASLSQPSTRSSAAERRWFWSTVGCMATARPPEIDAIERQLLGTDYVRNFDLMMVQTEVVRSKLLRAGAMPDRIVVTGNIKFDALRVTAGARSALQVALHTRATESSGAVVVAGSVTETEDQRAILEAFGLLRLRHHRAFSGAGTAAPGGRTAHECATRDAGRRPSGLAIAQQAHRRQQCLRRRRPGARYDG